MATDRPPPAPARHQPPAFFLLLFFHAVFVWHNAILSRTFSLQCNAARPGDGPPPPFPVAPPAFIDCLPLATPFYHSPSFPNPKAGQSPNMVFLISKANKGIYGPNFALFFYPYILSTAREKTKFSHETQTQYYVPEKIMR